MERIIIESPWAGHVSRNKAYLGMAIKDALQRGESPYASHGLLTQFLDDNVQAERKLGIEAGLAWAGAAERVVYYLDLGMSSGMRFALEKHVQRNRTIEVRFLSRQNTVEFKYKNYRGETSERKATIDRFYWGRTEYHPKDQILMSGFCLDRSEKRVFALEDMEFKENRTSLLDLFPS